MNESWLGRHGPYLLLLAFLYYCLQIAMAIFGDWFDLFEMLPITVNAVLVLVAAAFLGMAVRVVGELIRGTSWLAVLRDILGQPSWWRTWYPRLLRDPANVWDKLPPTLKVMQTVLWLELLLLPAGFILAVFVIPTFQAVFASLGMQFPLMMRTYSVAVTIGGYALPFIVIAALVQGRHWHAQHGVPGMVAFKSLFSVNRDFWRDTDARKLLMP